jgi:hypothetical protein
MDHDRARRSGFLGRPGGARVDPGLAGHEHEDATEVTGRYFEWFQPPAANRQASEVGLREALLTELTRQTGVPLPR